jgi:integrase
VSIAKYPYCVWLYGHNAGPQPVSRDATSFDADAPACRNSLKRRPCRPLLWVPVHPHRHIYADLDAAGVAKRLPGLGKVDFHALRVTFATLLMESGASAKECLTLMRHSTMQMTLDRYIKARPERLQAAAETVWQTMRKPTAGSLQEGSREKITA